MDKMQILTGQQASCHMALVKTKLCELWLCSGAQYSGVWDRCSKSALSETFSSSFFVLTDRNFTFSWIKTEKNTTGSDWLDGDGVDEAINEWGQPSSTTHPISITGVDINDKAVDGEILIDGNGVSSRACEDRAVGVTVDGDHYHLFSLQKRPKSVVAFHHKLCNRNMSQSMLHQKSNKK